MTSLSNFSLAPFWIRLSKKIYWFVHFKVKLTNSIYCNSMQNRKELSTFCSSIPFLFSQGPMSQCVWRQSKALGKRKILFLWLWYYLDQKIEDTDDICQQNGATQQSVTLVIISKQQPSHETANLGAWATVPTLQRDPAHWPHRTDKAVKFKG